MSQIHEKSPRHCAQKQENFNKFFILFFSLFILCLLILCFTLLLFVINPKKPQFILKRLNINELNFTGPSSFNSSIDLTLLSKNPNTRIGIHYDEIRLYGSYNGQKITLETSIAGFYQDHGQTRLLSTLLVGNEHVSPYLAYQVQRDQGTRKLVFNVKVTGRLRWKMGSWLSSSKKFSVSCITSAKQGTMCANSV